MSDREKLFEILAIATTSTYAILFILGKVIPVEQELVLTMLNLISTLLAPLWPITAAGVAAFKGYRLYSGKRLVSVDKNMVQKAKSL